MIEKKPLCPQRVRKITSSFAFIEHRLLRDGFVQSLTHHEMLLYVFLILAGDRKGLSYYRYDKICTLLRLSLDEYIEARDALIRKDLIAFDGDLFQVLSLPEKAPDCLPKTMEEPQCPAPIRHLILRSVKEIP